MDWGWPKDLERRTWGLGLYTDLFRSVVDELDRTRPYCDGSPYSPGFTAELEGGTVLATERVAVTADARTVARVTVSANLLAVGDAGTEVLVANLDGEHALHYFEEFKNLALEPHPFEASAFERDGQIVVAVRATGLVADLAIMADRIHPSLTVNDQLVTLLAGESVEFVLQRYAAGAAGAVQGFEELGTNDVLAAVQEALADPEREHVLVRAINTIRA